MDLLAANGLTRLAVLTGPAGKADALQCRHTKAGNRRTRALPARGAAMTVAAAPIKPAALPNGRAAAFLLPARLRLSVTGVSALAHVAILVALGLHAQNVTVLAPLNIDLIPKAITWSIR